MRSWASPRRRSRPRRGTGTARSPACARCAGRSPRTSTSRRASWLRCSPSRRNAPSRTCRRVTRCARCNSSGSTTWSVGQRRALDHGSEIAARLLFDQVFRVMRSIPEDAAMDFLAVVCRVSARQDAFDEAATIEALPASPVAPRTPSRSRWSARSRTCSTTPTTWRSSIRKTARRRQHADLVERRTCFAAVHRGYGALPRNRLPL